MNYPQHRQILSRAFLNGLSRIKVLTTIEDRKTARKFIRSELIESALALAEKGLPAEITAGEEQKRIEQYMEMTAGL